jgi:branched-chain amino acid transport system permease protein
MRVLPIDPPSARISQRDRGISHQIDRLERLIECDANASEPDMNFFLQIFVNGVLTGFVYALMALAIVIIYKSSSIFNFAHGSLVGLCTFMVWQMIVGWGFPTFLAFFVELVLIAGLAYALQQLVLKPLTGQPLMAAIMTTIALGELFSGVVVLFWPGPGRVLPVWFERSVLKVGPVVVSSDSLINCTVCVAGFAAFLAFFHKTRLGLAMRGTAEDHSLAQSEGVKVDFIFVVSWFVAILVAAVGGVLMSSLYGVSYESLQGLGMKALAVVILGGMESIAGALVGGLMIGVVESLGSGYVDPLVSGGFGEVAPYIVLLVVLVFRPFGLFGYERIERV